MLPATLAPGKARESRSLASDQTFLAAVLFELFFFVPIGAYLYFFHHDWSLMYFVDPGGWTEGLRVAVGAMAMSGYMGAAIAGAMVARKLIRDDKARVAVMIMAAAGIALGVFSAFTIRQLTQIGSFADWSAVPRTTEALHFHQVGITVGICGAVATVALAMMLRSLRKAN